MLDRADQKAARAACGVKNRFPLLQVRIDLLDDKLGDGTRSVELAGVACRLQVLE
ncbi:hypothetical protein D3C83_231890 [compost metagenome]